MKACLKVQLKKDLQKPRYIHTICIHFLQRKKETGTYVKLKKLRKYRKKPIFELTRNISVYHGCLSFYQFR